MELKDALEEDIMALKNNLEEALPPLKIVEETVIEDLSVPEIIAQEVIIKDGSITTIGAGPYNGFIQSPTAVRVPAFIAAIREDGEILSKSIIPIPLPASGDIPVPTAIATQLGLAPGPILAADALPAGLLPIRAATVTPGLAVDTTAANLVARPEGGAVAIPVAAPGPVAVPVVAPAPVAPVFAPAPVPVAPVPAPVAPV